MKPTLLLGGTLHPSALWYTARLTDHIKRLLNRPGCNPTQLSQPIAIGKNDYFPLPAPVWFGAFPATGVCARQKNAQRLLILMTKFFSLQPRLPLRLPRTSRGLRGPWLFGTPDFLSGINFIRPGNDRSNKWRCPSFGRSGARRSRLRRRSAARLNHWACGTGANHPTARWSIRTVAMTRSLGALFFMKTCCERDTAVG